MCSQHTEPNAKHYAHDDYALIMRLLSQQIHYDPIPILTSIEYELDYTSLRIELFHILIKTPPAVHDLRPR